MSNPSTGAAPLEVLAVTGGHRVDVVAFEAMLAAVCEPRGWSWTHDVQPGAQRWLRPEHAGRWDAILLHDLPGLQLRRGAAPAAVGPDLDTAQAALALLERGQGLVVMHHALAAWPAWEGWAEVLGGRFHYAPAWLRGQQWPSSGTRLGAQTARLVAPDHPVCEGLQDFGLTDELYCCPVFTDEVLPLLRTDADLDRRRFVRTYEHVLLGEAAAPDCRDHPPACDLLAWARAAGPSPVVCIQPGDSGATLALPAYRRLVANALRWVASAPARTWAADQHRNLPAVHLSDR